MKRFPLLTYFGLTYAISWLAALTLHLVARQAGLADFGELMAMAETTFSLGDISSQLVLPPAIIFLISRLVDFGPSIAGLLTPLLIGRPDEAKDILKQLIAFRLPARWYAWALLLPLGVVSAALGLHLLLGESAVTGPEWNGLVTLGQLFFWVFLMRTLLGGGLGEELGWRGFALPRLTVQHGAFQASLLIGLVWTFWHLPGHMTSDTPLVSLAAQLLYTVPLSFVFTWLYYRTSAGGLSPRLIPVVLMHGALNGFNAFFERSLFPRLAEEDGFVIFFILVVLVVGATAALQVRKIPQPGA